MRSNQERETQTTKTADETPQKPPPKKREPERPGADTIDDNPLICRGID